MCMVFTVNDYLFNKGLGFTHLAEDWKFKVGVACLMSVAKAAFSIIRKNF